MATNREYFDRARDAVMAKIKENDAAAAALKVTKSPLLPVAAGSVPDLDPARADGAPRCRRGSARPLAGEPVLVSRR